MKSRDLVVAFGAPRIRSELSMGCLEARVFLAGQQHAKPSCFPLLHPPSKRNRGDALLLGLLLVHNDDADTFGTPTVNAFL